LWLLNQSLFLKEVKKKDKKDKKDKKKKKKAKEQADESRLDTSAMDTTGAAEDTSVLHVSFSLFVQKAFSS